MIETAVILAAGLGSRLKDRTKEKPKGFLVIDQTSIIEASIQKLIKAGVNKIIIGTGYLANFYEDLSKKYPNIICKINSRYADTGSMYTLYNLKDLIKADFLLLESDLVYDSVGLDILIKETKKDVILASGETNSEDEVYIEFDKSCNLVNMSKDPKTLNSINGELVGISKVSFSTYQKMCNFSAKQFEFSPKLDYEYVFVSLAKDNDIYIKKVDDYTWCEIDNEEHLKRAKNKIYPKIKQNEAS
jgi:2-aminoethylphosphonate-pyruvate transaminase